MRYDMSRAQKALVAENYLGLFYQDYLYYLIHFGATIAINRLMKPESMDGQVLLSKESMDEVRRMCKATKTVT